MTKKRCASDRCDLKALRRGRVKTKGLRALEKANQELVRAARGLGELSWGPYPTLAAHFFVGLNKGKEPKNRTGWCSTQPEAFTPEKVDERFMALRTLRMRAKNEVLPEKEQKTPAEIEALVAASRVGQEGWFRGDRERSHRYSIFWNGDVPGESTPEAFARSMQGLADAVSATLCQDEVILSFETPTGNTAEGRVGDPVDYAMAAGAFHGIRRRR